VEGERGDIEGRMEKGRGIKREGVRLRSKGVQAREESTKGSHCIADQWEEYLRGGGGGARSLFSKA
jgi:hypothetical protein